MVFPLAGIIGGMAASRIAYSGFGQRLFKSPIISGGSFGVGYTGGSYLGYGASNTIDPFSLHNKSSYSRPKQLSYRMPYGYSRYSRYSRYRSRYGRRRSYYRRRPSYYSRYRSRRFY
ncbi:MAG TPA: hypothetical protein EYN67_16860 [Flavobacteriales bacterium]|nr:hypothetical protein [Flavobacteriales bacterium]